MLCTVAHCCLILSETLLKGLKRLSTGLADLTDDWAVEGEGTAGIQTPHSTLHPHSPELAHTHWEDVHCAMLILRW